MNTDVIHKHFESIGARLKVRRETRGAPLRERASDFRIDVAGAWSWTRDTHNASPCNPG
ncbi:MAG: hypothetical protein O7J95_00015 [Planctomycetota bacterium]|nr:hypothetical protein [Planctomycetota bacterium]